MWLNLLWPLRSPSKYRYSVPLSKSADCSLDCKSDSEVFEADETVFESCQSSVSTLKAYNANTSGELMLPACA